ncbi:MAG: isoleucine--tRNA ligase, partial [Clostridia bacterium]|nr:isoleucine--tRNA ligase [Clostridia bacterium]
VEAFERGETVTFEIEGNEVTLGKDDVLTAPMQKTGFVAQEDRGVMVVLDTNLTEALIQEGYVREVISKIQTMRKDAGFEVTDRIDVRYTCKEKLAAAIASGLDMIKNGTLALTVEMGEADDTYTAQEWKINDQKAVIAVRVSK